MIQKKGIFYLFLISIVSNTIYTNISHQKKRVLEENGVINDDYNGNFYSHHNSQKYKAITDYFKNGFATSDAVEY